MEQIRIRQPKMLAAQSFIQSIKTFLAILINLVSTYFPYVQKYLRIKKTAEMIGNTRFWLKKSCLIYYRKKPRKVTNLGIWEIYYNLLIFRYISFSSHVKHNLYFEIKKNLVFSLLNFLCKSFYALIRWMKKL